METCEKCGCDTFKVENDHLNGGTTITITCTKCGHAEELIDTYSDND